MTCLICGSWWHTEKQCPKEKNDKEEDVVVGQTRLANETPPPSTASQRRKEGYKTFADVGVEE